MGKIKDRILLGIISGFIGNIPKSLSNEFFYRRHLESMRFGNIVAGLFISPLETRRKSGTIWGIFSDFIFSSLLGIPLVYLLSATGKDKQGLKGAIIGIIGFGTFSGIMSKISTSISYPKDTITNALYTINSIIWGLTAGKIALILGDEDLFRPKPTLLSNPEEDS